MAEIINIKNEAGKVQYPVTKPECVIDENGKSVLTLIQENGTGLRQEIDELSERIDNLPQGDEFDKEGNYPLLHVGTADDLAGRGESVPAEFGFRASGGKSIKDGRAYIKRIKGNSVVWNQILKKREITWTINGITIIGNSDGSFILNGTATEDAWIAFTLTATIDIVSGHKFFYTGCPSGGAESTYCLWDGSGRIQDVGNGGIAVINDTFVSPRILVRKDYTCTNLVFTPRLTDLTQMFQAGNEPTTIEEFNARVATLGVDMNAYNEGQVIHCNTESIKSVGDNAWDEEWEKGTIADNTGALVNSESTIRSKNYIKVIGGQEYRFAYFGSAVTWYRMFYYDSDKALLYSAALSVNKNVTPPSNCAYIKFRMGDKYGTTYNNDIMITLVHSGWKQDTDAGYQPYWQDTLPLPIIRKYFPDGMKSVGTAHDEVRFNKASGKWEKVVRIGSVDMGTLNWAKSGTYTNGYYALPLSGAKPLQYPLCQLYSAVNVSYQQDKSIYVSNNGGQAQLFVIDSAYTDVASFKAAMAGVMLYYEAADWEWVELDAEDQNFRDYYNVADFGTEQSQSSVPSANFSADIIYQFNAVDMIREHEIEITELQNVIATMQAQLTALTNGGQ